MVAGTLIFGACGPAGLVVVPLDAPVVLPAAPAGAARRAPALAGPERFTGALALASVNKLAEAIGSREAGTANDDAAAAFIADTLRGYGYDVELQPFNLTVFNDLGSSLTVEGQTIETRTFAYSGSGDVTAELVDVGLGRVEDFASADVNGKIALIARGDIPFVTKLENANRAGARAGIIYNNQEGLFRGTAGTSGSALTPIPAVAISQADGKVLVARVRSGPTTAHVTATTRAEERTTSNVVGRRAGASGPRIVVGGHRDSVAAGPGANDDGSGVAVMLELARVVALNRPAIDFRFIAFGGEELGLLGSKHYVQQLDAADRAAIAAMINLDMVGVGDELLIGGSDQMIPLGLRIAGQHGTKARKIGGGLNQASDHASFMGAGIPAIFFYWSDDPNYHTANDRAEYVRPELLQLTGDMALDVAEAVAAGS